MLISEKFVFTPSLFPEGLGAKHPTNKLVADAAGGQPPEQNIKDAAGLAALGKPVVALVTDPRSWYLALWRQGCAAKGPLYRRLTDPAKWKALQKRRGGRIDKGEDSSAVPAEWGAEHAKTYWYGDSQSVPAFREWLKAVVGTRALRGMVSAEYQRSALSRSCGLMTFEFSQIFIHNPNDLGVPPTSWRGLQALNKAKGLVAHPVRAEDFAKDFLPAMETLGVALSEESRAAIGREQGRTPALRREWERFYDEESLKLLADRERFICATLRYRMGLAAAKASAGAEGAEGEGAAATAPAKKAAGKRAARKQQRAETAGEGRAAAGKVAPGKRAGKARRAAAEGAPAADPNDPAEVARQARIAEVKRLQEERLAQRKAQGKVGGGRAGKGGGKGAGKKAAQGADTGEGGAAGSEPGLTSRPRLADFDED